MLRKRITFVGLTIVVAVLHTPAPVYAQASTEVSLSPQGVRVSAASRFSESTTIDARTTDDRFKYGRVTVFGPAGISTAYGIRSEDGSSVLRTVNMAATPEADVYASGTVIRNHDNPKPIRLGGGFDLGSRPTGHVWVQDENEDTFPAIARMKITVDARRIPGRP
jgi:hypothetical protein